MNSPRSVACAIAVCLAVPVTAASAAEITLFEGPNFQGPNMTFNGEASNLDSIGFNDRASSAIVRDGVWEACVDAYFQGGCTRFQPGEYPRLDARVDRRISSLRVLQWQSSYNPQSYPDQGSAYYHRDGYREGYYGGNRGDGHDRGYYGYPYVDHGQ
ncbi:MAG TPA: beta/gamma crystallin-related protein [Casimicrobiaceae bacterium]